MLGRWIRRRISVWIYCNRKITSSSWKWKSMERRRPYRDRKIGSRRGRKNRKSNIKRRKLIRIFRFYSKKERNFMKKRLRRNILFTCCIWMLGRRIWRRISVWVYCNRKTTSSSWKWKRMERIKPNRNRKIRSRRGRKNKRSSIRRRNSIPIGINFLIFFKKGRNEENTKKKYFLVLNFLKLILIEISTIFQIISS